MLLVVAAVAIGAVLAPAVPGAGADPVLDFANTGKDGRGGGSYRTGVAPLVDSAFTVPTVPGLGAALDLALARSRPGRPLAADAGLDPRLG